jgi:DNA-directed RNA polymerase specialized sigma24 family protein
VSSGCEPKIRTEGAGRPAWQGSRDADPAHEVALVARAKRDLLLCVHRHRLRREDLEDCYSQATFELVARARRGAAFASRLHLARTLEQRFLSRVNDRRRALSGRSPMQAALECAASLDGAGREARAVSDPRSEPETVAILRYELGRLQELAERLTPEQRLVLATQVSLAMDTREFCELHGWTAEKYRKVAQRARARLRRLLQDDEQTVPSVAGSSEKAAGTCL